MSDSIELAVVEITTTEDEISKIAIFSGVGLTLLINNIFYPGRIVSYHIDKDVKAGDAIASIATIGIITSEKSTLRISPGDALPIMDGPSKRVGLATVLELLGDRPDPGEGT